MAKLIEVRMEGLNDLLRNLDVTKDIALTATATAMAKVSVDVANHAKENHSFQNRTGNLESSIQPLPVEIEENTVVGVVQASTKDKAGMEYAPGIEFGNPPHTITAKDAKALHWVGKDGKEHFAKSVNHPGNPPMPFMQPAVEANKQNLLDTVAKTVERSMQAVKATK